jgi:subtilase family serine protease
VDKLYFSTDGSVGAGDTVLGSATQSTALAAGGSYSVTLSVTLPDGVPAGSYYLLLRTDDAGEVAEANEDNNIALIPCAVG